MKPFILIAMLTIFSIGAFAQTTQVNLTFGGLSRDFLVHLPPNFSPSQHLPLVLNIHGHSLTALEEELYTNMDTTADNNHFVLVYPDGIGESWNVGIPGFNDSIDDIGFLSKIIDTVYQMDSINLNRVYACGLSFGGFMSHRLACELGDRIAAIASVSGVITDTVAKYCNPTHNIPVMQIHGTADPVVDYDTFPESHNVEQTINFWVQQNSCTNVTDTTNLPDINNTNSSTVQKIDHAVCSNQTQVLFYKIINGGHTWPQGAFTVPVSDYGFTNRDFSANAAIWNFFKQYTLNGLADGISEPTEKGVSLRVYPNPANNELVLEATEPIRHVELMNLLGEKIFSVEASANSATLNLSNVANGFYLLKIEGDNFSETRKVVKN